MMKYVSPKIELSMLEVKDIITASGDKYEIENEGDKGNVIINAMNIFKQ